MTPFRGWKIILNLSISKVFFLNSGTWLWLQTYTAHRKLWQYSQQRICFFHWLGRLTIPVPNGLKPFTVTPTQGFSYARAEMIIFTWEKKLVALGWKWLIFTHLGFAQLEAFSLQTFFFQPLVDVSGLAGTDIKSLYLGNMYGRGFGEGWPHLMRSSKSGHEVTKSFFFNNAWVGWESHQNNKQHTNLFSPACIHWIIWMSSSFRPLKNTWESFKKHSTENERMSPPKRDQFSNGK